VTAATSYDVIDAGQDTKSFAVAASILKCQPWRDGCKNGAWFAITCLFQCVHAAYQKNHSSKSSCTRPFIQDVKHVSQAPDASLGDRLHTAAKYVLEHEASQVRFMRPFTMLCNFG
jgi:hypothetical protein